MSRNRRIKPKLPDVDSTLAVGRLTIKTDKKPTPIYLPMPLRLRIMKYQLEVEELSRPRNGLIVQAIEEWLTKRGY